jgi:DNA-binding GntR family transcriptional regulator
MSPPDVHGDDAGDVLAPARSWDLGSHAQRLSRSLHSGTIAARLREAIISGALQAGAPLSERHLAERLGVSRGPIRSALVVLEGEGLVETGSNGRAVVRGFGAPDIADLMAVRLELESTAVRWAVEREADFGQVREILAGMEAEEASSEHLVSLDVSFHLAIVEASKSRFLVQSWQAIAPVVHTVITLGNRSLEQRDPVTNLQRIVDSHRRILTPLTRGSADLAVRRLGEQFDFTESMFSD